MLRLANPRLEWESSSFESASTFHIRIALLSSPSLAVAKLEFIWSEVAWSSPSKRSRSVIACAQEHAELHTLRPELKAKVFFTLLDAQGGACEG
jgi:hypothetical protein